VTAVTAVTPSPGAPALEIRPLRTTEEYQECVRLQERTWGEDFSERVPLAILKVGQRIGGVTAGAFDASGRMLGFVFGLTGVEGGRLVHWSDMLAVVPEARNLGIGRLLKEHQRTELLAHGVDRVYWTYDPLVSRNAHINLNVLGARAVEYVVDMYGSETASVLHRGLGTDRFVVAWDIGAAPGPRPVRSPHAVTLLASREEAPVEHPLATDGAPSTLAIEIPADIGAIQGRSVDLAGRWREATRRAFTSALERGYRVAGFDPPAGGDSGRYLLRTEEQ
jgi:predicted GNAT superfamily acetyltransferase